MYEWTSDQERMFPAALYHLLITYMACTNFREIDIAMNWIVSLQYLYIEALTPKVMVSGDGK